MKNLSELPMDTMLTIEHQGDGEFEVMSKEDYLDSVYFLDYPGEPFTVVTVADKTVVKFNLDAIIEYLGDGETYDDWESDVWTDIKSAGIDAKGIEKTFNDIFAKNPTYWEGETVMIDMVPEGVKPDD